MREAVGKATYNVLNDLAIEVAKQVLGEITKNRNIFCAKNDCETRRYKKKYGKFNVK